MSGQNVFVVNGEADFQREVVARSREVPVLVDFWAPWCGPCRMLTPTLEKLAQEFNGRFLLAKINTDQNQQISMQFGVRGIPNVKLFMDGQVVDEFVGAQPEPMVRQFLQRHVPAAPPRSQPRTQQQAPQEANGRLRLAKQHLRQGKGCEASNLLANFPDSPQTPEANKLRPLADFMCKIQRGESISNKNDLNALYRQAAEAVRTEPSAALYHLLVVMHQEQAAGRSQVKAIMEGIFTLLGENNTLVQQYRQQLVSLGL